LRAQALDLRRVELLAFEAAATADSNQRAMPP